MKKKLVEIEIFFIVVNITLNKNLESKVKNWAGRKVEKGEKRRRRRERRAPTAAAPTPVTASSSDARPIARDTLCPMKSPCAIAFFFSVRIGRSLCVYICIKRHFVRVATEEAIHRGCEWWESTDLESRRKPRLGRCTHGHQIKPDLHSVNNESPRGCPLGCNNHGHTVLHGTVSRAFLSRRQPERKKEKNYWIDERKDREVFFEYFEPRGKDRGIRRRIGERWKKSHGRGERDIDWWPNREERKFASLVGEVWSRGKRVGGEGRRKREGEVSWERDISWYFCIIVPVDLEWSFGERVWNEGEEDKGGSRVYYFYIDGRSWNGRSWKIVTDRTPCVILVRDESVRSGIGK